MLQTINEEETTLRESGTRNKELRRRREMSAATPGRGSVSSSLLGTVLNPTPALVAFTLNLAGILFSHGTKFDALDVLPVLL